MKTYKIIAEYADGYEGWLAIGCPENEVGRYVDSYLEEQTHDGKKRFKKIIIAIEN